LIGGAPEIQMKELEDDQFLLDAHTFKGHGGKPHVPRSKTTDKNELLRYLKSHVSLSTLSTPLHGSDLTFKLDSPYSSFNTENHETAVAFHGTGSKNILSVLFYGLNQHLSIRSAFGPGIYLASDLKTALSFAKPGRSVSDLGRYKVVLLCRVALSESVTKRMDKKQRGISFDDSKTPGRLLLCL
jgi:hypothetical protein